MKFIIRKTSLWSNDVKPCEEAFKMFVEKWHTRTCTEEEFNKKFSHREGLWRDNGKNHTIEQGCIKRQENDEEVWGIEINTLEELIEFNNKYGRIILEDSWDNGKEKQIEIYNDYRE